MDIVRARHGETSADFSRVTNDRVFEELILSIEQHIANGDSVVCEGLFISEARRARLAMLAGRARVVFVYVTAPVEVLQQRLQLRLVAGTNSEGNGVETLTADLLETLFRACKVPADNALVLDSSFLSIDDSLRACIAFVG
jgi:predicted kinase